MTVLNIRISETGGAPWKIDIDNLSREDATGKEIAFADEIESSVKEFIRGRMKPGSEVAQPKVNGSRD